MIESGALGTLLAFTGALDAASAAKIEPGLLAGVAKHPAPWIIDLRGVTFVCSTTMGMLVRVATLHAQTNHSTVLLVGGGAVEQAIRAARLDSLFRLAHSLELARDAARLPPLDGRGRR